MFTVVCFRDEQVLEHSTERLAELGLQRLKEDRTLAGASSKWGPGEGPLQRGGSSVMWTPPSCPTLKPSATEQQNDSQYACSVLVFPD